MAEPLTESSKSAAHLWTAKVALALVVIVVTGYFIFKYATPHAGNAMGNAEAEVDATLARAQIETRRAAGEEGVIQVSGCVPEPQDWVMERHEIKPGTIFVSVASYRDDECKDTVYQMFKKARNKDMIFAGVCQQNKEGEEDCFDKCPECSEKKQQGQIRVINMPHTEAKGPTWGRFQCSKLWKGEEWFLQIDSHTRFEDDWDVTLIDQLKSTNDPKACLGAYPPTQDQMNDMRKDNFNTMITMCPNNFDASGLPQIRAEVVPTKGRKTPLPIALLSAGMMCIPGVALYDVPFDPYLSYVFFSEELVFSARLYTAGYNLYAPTRAFCVHHYGREDKPKYWQDHKNSEPCKKRGLQRSKYILGLVGANAVHPDYLLDVDKYGLGHARSIDDFWSYAGINPSAKVITKGCPTP